MSLDLGVMSAAVTLDDADYRRKLSGMEAASEGTFKRIAQFAAGYLTGRALIGFAQAGVQAFADLETASWNFDQVFKKIPRAAAEAEAEMRSTYKLSETTSKTMLSTAADQLQAFGFSAEKSLELARKASQRGIDIASFKGGNQAEAVNAIVSALTGQTESMKRYGVVIQQSSAKYQEMVKSIMKTTGATELQAKAQATLNMIIEQTKNAEGDYIKEGSTIAQQQMDNAQAAIKAKEALGKILAEGVSPLMTAWGDLLRGFATSDEMMQRLIVRGAGVAAALALIGKSGAIGAGNRMLEGAANMLSGAMKGGGFGGVKEQAEVQAVAAAENLKRAEYEKTAAMRESRAAMTARRMAIYQRKEAEIAANSARYELSGAMKGGDEAQILAAKKRLAAAENTLTKAQVAEAQATQTVAAKHQLAMTATAQHTAATRANTIAQNTNAKAATFAGRAQIVLSNGMRVAKTAAAGLYAALGPVGIALLAVSAGYMVFQHFSEKNRKELEYATESAQRRVDAAKAEAEAAREAMAAETSNMTRLQELSRYERLNDSEKKESQKIIEELTRKYGDLGISYDTVTGRIRIATGAMAKLNAEQAKLQAKKTLEEVNANQDMLGAKMNNLRNALGTYWSNLIGGAANSALYGTVPGLIAKSTGLAKDVTVSSENQSELDKINKLRSREAQLVALEKLRNKLINDSKDDEEKKVQEVIDVLKKQIALEKQLADMNAARKKGENGRKGKPGELRQQSEAERKAQTSLEDREWQFKFDTSTAEQQAAMLQEKIDKIFKRQSGKYSTLDDFKNADRSKMTEQELKDLQEIVELEDRRRKIRKESERAFQSENETYQRYLKQREKSQQDKAVERELRRAEKEGGPEAADKIMRREYEKAQAAAVRLKGEYEAAVKEAQKDGIMTEEERKRIDERRRAMEQALADQDRWGDRIKDSEDRQANTRKQIGSFSTEVLNAMLGGNNSPEKETAKNTKEMVRLQRQTLEKTASSGTYK